MSLKQLFRHLKKGIFLMSIFLSIGAFAQSQKTVTGTVNAEGAPLPGASVMAKNTKIGTATDFDGKFTLSVHSNVTTLVVSFMGYQSQEVAITGQPLVIELLPEANMMDEVVITALGVSREKRAVGYAVQEVQGDKLQKVQGVNTATAMTGKVAGVLVKNTSDFAELPEILIRGKKGLIVIDGVPYENKTINDIPAADIKNISVLKGATASALYGERGRNGAIMITTNTGKNVDGMKFNFTSNTLYSAGFLAIPEKQNIYGRGTNNIYDVNSDSSWGTLMDGRILNQWDPISKTYRDYKYLPIGANNFENFLEQGYMLNNNFEMAYGSENTSLRSSLNWVQNKGVYPNSLQNKYTFSLGGDAKLGNFKMSSNVAYARNVIPNKGSNGYTSYDPMFSLLIWGPSDFNILDYKNNYWITKDIEQNYTLPGENNPYFDRYEKINEVSRDLFNVDFTVKYDINDWMALTWRTGLDYESDKATLKVSKDSQTYTGNTPVPGNQWTWNGYLTGAYVAGRGQNSSINSDLFLGGTKEINDFSIEYLLGGAVFSFKNNTLYAATNGGIVIPGYFALNNSTSKPDVSESYYNSQSNSVYFRFAPSWKRMLYLDITGRNDWFSSMISTSTPSYFYPSVSGSFVVSELFGSETKSWLDLLKLRASWTMTKSPFNPYQTNSVYDLTTSTWNDITGATAPSALYADNLKPQVDETTEYGLQTILLKNKLSFDVTYFSKLMYDNQVFQSFSPTSGYTSILRNWDESYIQKGWELSLKYSPIKKDNWKWDLETNWSTQNTYYDQLDEFSANKPWVKVGERVDHYILNDYQRDPATGQIIYQNGRILRNPYESVYGYKDVDWIWGLSSDLSYKNLSLSFSFDGVKGGLMNTRTESYMWQAGVHPDSATPERYLDVTNPGSQNYIGEGLMVVSGSVVFDPFGNIVSDTRQYAANNVPVSYKNAVMDLHDSSAWGGAGTPTDAYQKTFFKLREVSLTYSLPTSLFKGNVLDNASISFIGQNVFLWAKDFKYSDPDAGNEDFVDPSMRYLGIKVNAGF